MKKKVLAVMAAMALTLSLSVTAFAAETEKKSGSEDTAASTQDELTDDGSTTDSGSTKDSGSTTGTTDPATTPSSEGTDGSDDFTSNPITDATLATEVAKAWLEYSEPVPAMDDVAAGEGVTVTAVTAMTSANKELYKSELATVFQSVPQDDIWTVYTWDIVATGSGNVTLTIPNLGTSHDGKIAIVSHYDGTKWTRQFVTIANGGKITANFASFSPVGVIVTEYTSVAELEATGLKTVAETTKTTSSDSETPKAPKGSDDLGILYLLLAVAAVAGAGVVATKKVR